MTPSGKTAHNAVVSRLAEAYAENRLLSSIDIARDRRLAQTLVAKLLTMLSLAGLVVKERGEVQESATGWPVRREISRCSTLCRCLSDWMTPLSVLSVPIGVARQDPGPFHEDYVRFNEQFDSFLRKTKFDVFSVWDLPTGRRGEERKAKGEENSEIVAT